MSTLTHSRLWQQSGRWDDAGPELFRLSDRRDNQLCLAPTCEGRSGQDEEIEVTLWARISKNLDCSTGPLARPFARTTHSLSLLRPARFACALRCAPSFARSLAHSLARGKVSY